MKIQVAYRNSFLNAIPIKTKILDGMNAWISVVKSMPEKAGHTLPSNKE